MDWDTVSFTFMRRGDEQGWMVTAEKDGISLQVDENEANHLIGAVASSRWGVMVRDRLSEVATKLYENKARKDLGIGDSRPPSDEFKL